MKHLVYIFLLGWLTSCGYRTLEGRVKPIYFSADTTVFKDTLVRAQMVTYKGVMRLSVPCLDIVDLKRGETTMTLIPKPTIFRKDGWEFLVYPGEKIFITANDSNNYVPAFSTVNQNKARDAELLILKRFQQLEKEPKVPRLFQYDLGTLLDLEKALTSEIAPAEWSAQVLFDSLCNVYHASKKFKRLTSGYVHHRYSSNLLTLYEGYRDTFSAHRLYESKVRGFMPKVNGFTTNHLNLNDEANANYLYTCLYPHSGISGMVSGGAFEACFDTIATNFTGPARDYLLSRLMYHACEQGFDIPASYWKQYRDYSMNKGYRKIIVRADRAHKHLRRETPLLPNDLLLVDGKTKIRLENVLSQYKGRYVLMDLWASWCMPCIEEMPALEAVKRRYPADKIAIVSVSVDANVSAWQTRLTQLRRDTVDNYLLLNKDGAGLVRQISLNTIPRYLLYDQEGHMLNANVPPPSEPALLELLDKIILK